MRQKKQRLRLAGGRRWLRVLLISVVCMIGLGLMLGGVAAAVAYRSLIKDLPGLEELDNYTSSLVTHVYDRHNELIADFFIEKRVLVQLDEIPLFVRQATLAVEDARFYSHNGADMWGILRAAWVNFRAGEVREGASTLTQQVARTLFLSRDRTMRRKLREVILAWRIEQHFGKDDILRMYLNQVFYGHNAYGVEAAAQIYFGKSAKDLTLGEGTLIAGLTQAPNKYSPINNLELSMQRREHVLRRMVEVGYLDAAQARRVAQEPVHLTPNYQQINKAPYFVEHIRRYLETQYGTKTLYRGGFHVYTTLDLHLQRVAESAVQHGVEAMDKRHGYLGPVRRIALSGDVAQDRANIEAVTLNDERDGMLQEGERLTGVVVRVDENAVQVAVKDTQGVMLPEEGFDWVREADLSRDFETRKRLTPHEIFQPGDVIRVRVVRADANDPPYRLALEQDPLVQGALLAMEAKTGHVLAMVGGYDYATSQFNRATQAIRQPGSAFKPIIYTAALESGKTPSSIVYDRAVVKEDENEAWMWKPENYSQRYYGATTVRQALTYSRNMVTIRLTEEIGVPAVLDTAKRLGITSHMAPYLSLALGSSGVSLQEITASMGAFANGGLYVPPIFIHRIVDANDQVIEENLPRAQRAIRPDIAYVMTSMLQDVIENGTGRRVRVLGRPVAGKTGTTNDFRDAWFLGYTPDLVAGVWLGIDDRRVLGHRESGGRVAAPVWLEFMQAAVQGQPITDFPIPPQVRFYRVDAQSGRLASDSNEGAAHFEAFAEGTAPQEPEAPSHDLRRNIYRLDRQDRSAARSLQSLDRKP